MLYRHRSQEPRVDPSASIASTAVLAGDVTIGANCTIGHGALLVAEGSPIILGTYVVVREQALLRSTATHPLHIGDHVLVGPQARLYGCHIEDEAFLDTGVTVFHGATIGQGAEVRVNGVVHISTTVVARAIVPIGWVAVGTPAQILPPDQHQAIWRVQEPLDFPKVVYSLGRCPDGSVDMKELTRRAVQAVSAQQDGTTETDRRRSR
jgi:carbonic anhydrase/acetyltransferase-like protein (isoleucine patch superfamily)